MLTGYFYVLYKTNIQLILAPQSGANYILGAVHKRYVRSEEGGLSSANIFRTLEVLQMRTFALYGTKIIEFLETYGVSARTKGG